MNKQTKIQTIALLTQSAAEIAADIAELMSEAATVASEGNHFQAVGATMSTDGMMEQLQSLITSVKLINQASEQNYAVDRS